MQAALQELRKKKGVSVRSLARKYGIPPSTLHRHARMESRIGAGHPTILTPEEEKEVVYSCQVLQEMGFGMTREMVGAIVVDYLTTSGRDNPFNGQPVFTQRCSHSSIQGCSIHCSHQRCQYLHSSEGNTFAYGTTTLLCKASTASSGCSKT